MQTEIARRIAKLSQAPFIKVEATKFTEVGFHGKDVDQIIRDLVDISINMTRKRIKEEVKAEIAAVVEDRLLSELIGMHSDESQRESFRTMLREGELENREIDIDVPHRTPTSETGMRTGAGSFDTGALAGEVFKMMNKMQSGGGAGRSKSNDRKKLKSKLSFCLFQVTLIIFIGIIVSEARPMIEEMEIERLLEDYDIPREAIAAVEESGIVFIDEIDKLVSTGDYRGADASSEGVQRDLLPLIEGSTISTKHGNVNTDFILFICSGAFHASKPSDLLAELQGRLPIRVTLKGLTEDDLYRILTEPEPNLLRQQIEMLKSEQVTLEFTDEAIREIAKVAFMVSLSSIILGVTHF